MFSSLRKSLFILVLLINGSANIQAEEDDYLEFLLFMEIPQVITSTLTERDIINAPSSMTVVTREDIKSSGCASLMELIDQQPGFMVTKNNYGFDLLTVRGISSTISNDKIKMLINGHAVSEAIWSSFSLFADLPLENIQQVEIMRGPGSSLYGTDAFAAIINVITKKAGDQEKIKIDLKAESFSTERIDANYAYKGDNSAFNLNLNYYETDGDDLILERDGLFGTPFAYAPESMTEGAKELRLMLDYEFKDFSLQAAYFDVESQLPIGQSYLTQDEENQYYDYFFIEGKYNLSVSDLCNIIFKASVDTLEGNVKGDVLPDNSMLLIDLNGDGIPEPADISGNGIPEFWPEGVYSDFGYKSIDYKAEILLDYNLSGSNKLLLGAFFERTETSDIKTKSNGHPLYMYSTSPFIIDYSDSVAWNKEADRDIWGIFFQDEWQMNEEFYLALGARYDDFSDFGSTFNPRCALVWDFNHIGGVVKLIYSTAFKAPTFSQLYNKNNPSLVGNPDLDAEVIESVELAVNYIFFEKLQSTLSVFSITTEDQIDISDTRDMNSPLNPYYYENKKGSEIKGAEIEARYAFAERNYIFASYVYNDACDADTDKTLPWIPENQVTLGVNVFLLDKLNININLDYTDELPREAGDIRENIDSTLVFDFSLRLENIGSWDFYFSAMNFTDEDIYSPSPLARYPQTDIPRSGDSYRVGATYKY